MNNKIIYFEKRLEMNELKKIIKEYIKKIGKEKIAIIVSIITIVTVGFNFFKTVYNDFIYQASCERFYGIPKYYFSYNLNDKLYWLLLTSIAIIICLTPRIIKKHCYSSPETFNRIIKYIFIFLCCMSLWIVISLFLNIIVSYNYRDFILDGIVYLVNTHRNVMSVVFLLFSFFTILFLYDISGFLKTTRYKKIVLIIFLFSFGMCSNILLFGSISQITSTIDQKTKYEFITVDDNEYVILSGYKGKFLVVSFEKDEGEYIFNTNQYKFINMNQGLIIYKDVKNLKINKGK
ncbi:MAG: hypothetical protein V8R62_00105 [Faecalibacillus intestinalis]